MKIFIDNQKYEYELKVLLDSFEMKYENILDVSDCMQDFSDEDIILFNADFFNDNLNSFLKYNLEIDSIDFLEKKGIYILYKKYSDIVFQKDEYQSEDYSDKNSYKRLLYNYCSNLNNGKKLFWGVLTGIRPTKLYSSFAKNIKDRELLNDTFKKLYCLEDSKIELLEKVYRNQKNHLDVLKSDNFSVYIHIPFCPSKCNYCTFYSNDINKKSHLVKDYLKALDEEISATLSDKWCEGKKIDSLYVGGGTPTSLSEEDLIGFFEILKKHFDFSKIREKTFEAGRADTITREKLDIIKKYGVDRISINPQTMNDKTLKRIGRNHSVDDVVQKYNMAREAGISNINMDIILGLDGEDISDLRNTIDCVLKLEPDSITVHTLSIKKSSDISKSILKEDLANRSVLIDDMLNLVYSSILDKYQPYYLYRQKNILGGHENVGLAKENKESIYNIIIMEEIQNILAFGPNAVSRFVYSDENRIERVSNTKNLELYINNVGDCIAKKRKEMSV